MTPTCTFDYTVIDDPLAKAHNAWPYLTHKGMHSPAWRKEKARQLYRYLNARIENDAWRAVYGGAVKSPTPRDITRWRDLT